MVDCIYVFITFFCLQDIHGILNKIPNGPHFVETLKGKQTANYQDRKVICHALVSHLMKNHGTKYASLK